MHDELKCRYVNYIRKNNSFLLNRSFRFVGIPFLGIIVYLVILVIHPSKDFMDMNPTWVHYLGDIIISIIISLIIWEGSLIINRMIDKKIDWRKNPLKKLAYQISLNTIYSTTVIKLILILYLKFILKCPVNQFFEEIRFVVFLGAVIFLLVDVVYLGVYFFRQWEALTIETEELKRQNLQSQFETLKNQVNPHFLFNSLNALTTLIAEDQKLAIEFVQRLANVYRYVLQNKDKELVDLREEVQFIKAYLFLQKIRFDENLRVNIRIPECSESFLIAPLTLQMLVENAIKHNVISHEKPLCLDIILDCDSQLIVKNTLQKKFSSNGSTGIGLRNIIDRYSLLMNKNITITESSNEFIVTVPLIKEKKKYESVNN